MVLMYENFQGDNISGLSGRHDQRFWWFFNIITHDSHRFGLNIFKLYRKIDHKVLYWYAKPEGNQSTRGLSLVGSKVFFK